MKNILVLAHDDAGQNARIQAALDITRALEGHLICLDVVQLPVMGGDYLQEAGQTILLEDEQARESVNRARLTALLRKEDVQWEVRETTGDIKSCVAREAGLADLIVVNRKLDNACGPDMRWIASSIALKARKPIVAVAEDCPGFEAAGRALVAWDGSMPAMAALTAAVPLLGFAASVTILQIGDEDPAIPAEEAASYLSRHDIHAVIRREEAGKMNPAVLIQRACAEIGVSYCVMGAYGHSPLRETIFGGVTRRMLSSSFVPLVIAH